MLICDGFQLKVALNFHNQTTLYKKLRLFGTQKLRTPNNPCLILYLFRTHYFNIMQQVRKVNHSRNCVDHTRHKRSILYTSYIRYNSLRVRKDPSGLVNYESSVRSTHAANPHFIHEWAETYASISCAAFTKNVFHHLYGKPESLLYAQNYLKKSLVSVKL